jgi:hypothetical protein
MREVRRAMYLRTTHRTNAALAGDEEREMQTGDEKIEIETE